MDNNTDLRAQRDALAIEMYNSETSAFPGSRAYSAYSKAMLALSAFDDAHPEIIKAIQAER